MCPRRSWNLQRSRLAPNQDDAFAEGTQGHDGIQSLTNHYYAKIAFDDHAIGIVLESLRERDLMDNTSIAHTSDNREMLGDHRFCQKSVFYEGALNVPLIVRPPGGGEPWTGRRLADHFDISATLLDLAKATLLGADYGISLLSIVESGPDSTDAQQGKGLVFSEVNLYSMARTKGTR